MKYFIVAGEASGDLHGSNLMKAIKEKDPNADFTFLGGDLMKKQGGNLIIHYRRMAFMGGIQILTNLKTIFQNINRCKNEIIETKPDIIVLIDYAGFNLKIARFAKKNGFLVHFYISPKVWAWRESRVKKIKQYIDKMYVILPFEKSFYAKHNYNVDYVGNPLLDSIKHFNDNNKEQQDGDLFGINGKYIALLAGSRKQEVELLLKEMLICAEYFSKEQFILAAAPSLPKEFYQKFRFPENVKIVYNQTYQVLKNAYAAIVTSGTATLETGLFEIPQVVVYKTNSLQYFVGRLVVNVKKFKYFSLVNLILQRPAVKEILQFKVAGKTIGELERILYNTEHRQQILDSYKELKSILGDHNPSSVLAEKIVDSVS